MTATRIAVTETYEDVEDLLYHTVHEFVRFYGGDFEEYVSEANVLFMKIYGSFDPSKGKFATYFTTSLWWHLMNSLNKHISRKMTSIDVDNGEGCLAEQIEDHPHSKFSLANLANELTDDARTVLSLVFEAPAELEAVVIGKGGEPRNWRSTIRNHLYDVGWTCERIAESFDEIRLATL